MEKSFSECIAEGDFVSYGAREVMILMYTGGGEGGEGEGGYKALGPGDVGNCKPSQTFSDSFQYILRVVIISFLLTRYYFPAFSTLGRRTRYSPVFKLSIKDNSANQVWNGREGEVNSSLHASLFALFGKYNGVWVPNNNQNGGAFDPVSSPQVTVLEAS